MNIYIANLSFGVNDANLKDLFTEYGEVFSTKVIVDKMSGKSRGFGFIEMPNASEAKKAIEGLNGTKYDSRVIAVCEAKPKVDRSNSYGGDKSYGDSYNNSRRY